MPPVGFEPKISSGEQPQAAHLLRSWVRIPPGAWIFVCCECRVLSGRGLCDEMITRPKESYRLWCVIVCDLEASRICTPYIYDISSLRVKIAFPKLCRAETCSCVCCGGILSKHFTTFLTFTIIEQLSCLVRNSLFCAVLRALHWPHW